MRRLMVFVGCICAIVIVPQLVHAQTLWWDPVQQRSVPSYPTGQQGAVFYGGAPYVYSSGPVIRQEHNTGILGWVIKELSKDSVEKTGIPPQRPYPEYPAPDSKIYGSYPDSYAGKGPEEAEALREKKNAEDRLKGAQLRSEAYELEQQAKKIKEQLRHRKISGISDTRESERLSGPGKGQEQIKESLKEMEKLRQEVRSKEESQKEDNFSALGGFVNE